MSIESFDCVVWSEEFSKKDKIKVVKKGDMDKL